MRKEHIREDKLTSDTVRGTNKARIPSAFARLGLKMIRPVVVEAPLENASIRSVVSEDLPYRSTR